MTDEQCLELTGLIMGRFQMIGQFVNDAAERAYFDLLSDYDYLQARRIVTTMLRDNREPGTDFDLRRLLYPSRDAAKVRPAGNFTEPSVGRKIMRDAWVKSSCQRHGITPEEFFERDRVAAKKGRWEPLKQQWARVDKVIAARKAKGLPVDESGLTYMAPVMAPTTAPAEEVTRMREMFAGEDPFA